MKLAGENVKLMKVKKKTQKTTLVEESVFLPKEGNLLDTTVSLKVIKLLVR